MPAPSAAVAFWRVRETTAWAAGHGRGCLARAVIGRCGGACRFSPWAGCDQHDPRCTGPHLDRSGGCKHRHLPRPVNACVCFGRLGRKNEAPLDSYVDAARAEGLGRLQVAVQGGSQASRLSLHFVVCSERVGRVESSECLPSEDRCLCGFVLTDQCSW